MASIVCGSELYFEIEVWNGSTLVYTIQSEEILSGWEYEQTYDSGTWHSVTGSGVAVAHVGASQRIRYTFQSAYALTAGITYKIKARQAEVVNVV